MFKKIVQHFCPIKKDEVVRKRGLTDRHFLEVREATYFCNMNSRIFIFKSVYIRKY